MTLPATFEPNGQATPQTRAAIVGEYVRLIGCQMGSISFSRAFEYLLEAFQAEETQIAHEIHIAHFIAIRSGLATSNTGHTIAAETEVTPSALLRNFVWDGGEPWQSVSST